VTILWIVRVFFIKVKGVLLTTNVTVEPWE
jgi:hypothetical protein